MDAIKELWSSSAPFRYGVIVAAIVLGALAASRFSDFSTGSGGINVTGPGGTGVNSNGQLPLKGSTAAKADDAANKALDLTNKGLDAATDAVNAFGNLLNPPANNNPPTGTPLQPMPSSPPPAGTQQQPANTAPTTP